jgi:hypothetical protein
MGLHVFVSALTRCFGRDSKVTDPPSRGLICAPLFGVNLDLPSTSVKQRDWIADVTGSTVH